MRTADDLARELRAKAKDLEREAARCRRAADILDPPAPRQPRPGRKPGARPALREAPPEPAPEPAKAEAPFGYKADGTPRKRPATATAEQLARARAVQAKRRAKAKREAEQRRETVDEVRREEKRLRVLSQTRPPAAELKDRKVAHVTAEPA